MKLGLQKFEHRKASQREAFGVLSFKCAPSRRNVELFAWRLRGCDEVYGCRDTKEKPQFQSNKIICFKLFTHLQWSSFSRIIKINDAKQIKLKSIIICPACGFRKEKNMPEDSCQFFYKCENCKIILIPQKGDCCVFVRMLGFLARHFMQIIVVVAKIQNLIHSVLYFA